MQPSEGPSEDFSKRPMAGRKPEVVAASMIPEAIGVAGRGLGFRVCAVAAVVLVEIFVHDEVAAARAGFCAGAAKLDVGGQITVGHLQLTVLT